MTDFSHVAWRKSSRSANNGECVEVGRWRKSTHSTNNGSCVELAQLAKCVAVRDSKNPDGPKLAFARSDFRRLVVRVKANTLDL